MDREVSRIIAQAILRMMAEDEAKAKEQAKQESEAS